MEISANLIVCQGYPMPYNVARGSADGTLYALAVNEVDQFRLPDLFSLDLRLVKEFKIGAEGTFTLIADAFTCSRERCWSATSTLPARRPTTSPSRS